jgi:hypothetical protein
MMELPNPVSSGFVGEHSVIGPRGPKDEDAVQRRIDLITSESFKFSTHTAKMISAA